MKRKDAQKSFVPGTSRGTRRATTLLAQVADLERGERIKQLREALHLTQPVIAERCHVTLRAEQGWEAGGGIQWENAKRLAKVLLTSPDYIMSGERVETPDLSLSQTDRLELQIADVHRKLNAILERLGPATTEAAPAAAPPIPPLPPGAIPQPTEQDELTTREVEDEPEIGEEEAGSGDG